MTDIKNSQLIETMQQNIAEAVQRVRDTTPLAQSFTNFVTMNLVANAQLAMGGTAAMSFLPDDIADIAHFAGASYINVGTLLESYQGYLATIAREFHRMQHPWVLDPVAAGIGNMRTAILRDFKEVPPTIIRGNASEILAMQSLWDLQSDIDTTQSHGPAGVESVDSVDDAVNAAVTVARFIEQHSSLGKAAVAVSGEQDVITDGHVIYRLSGGSSMMTKITGAGCSLGGVIATYATQESPIVAAVAGSALFKQAAHSAQLCTAGPGSFQVALLDALWNITPQDVAACKMTATVLS